MTSVIETTTFLDTSKKNGIFPEQYFQKIWQARYFWLHLTASEVRAKFRRSTLGTAWSILQPLMMTLLLSFVMGSFFHMPMTEYAPYVFSGLIIWEFIVGSTVAGSNSFINAEGYIKQFNHPLAIYPLRNVLAALINFLFAFVGLLIWVAFWKPSNFGWPLFTLLFSFPLFIFTAWPLALIAAFITTKFRDFSQLIIIILQAIWYTSPVFFEPKLFKAAGIGFLVDYNPIYHFLNLIRAPVLYAQCPIINDFAYTLGFAAILWLCALYKISREERKLIFYL